MTSHTGRLSIYTLPTFLQNLHLSQQATKTQKCTFSTACGSNRIFQLQRSQRRCHISHTCIPDRALFDSPKPAQNIPSRRFKSTTSRKTKSAPALSSKPSTQSRSEKTRDRKEDRPKKPEPWKIQEDALKKKFPEGWNPRRRLSPDAMEGVRHLHQVDSNRFSTPVLAEHFKVSPEAIRRILKSRWRPKAEELEDKRERWQRREARVWNQLAELGLRPQRKAFSELSDVQVLKEGDEDGKEDGRK